METQVRYLGIELLSECPHCGNPLLLNGPLRVPLCPSCKRRVNIPERFMHRALVYYGDAVDAPSKTYGPHKEMPSGFSLRHTLKAEHPRCAKCNATLPCDDIATGYNGTGTCAKCGTLFDTYPAPRWLAKMFPEFTQVFNGARDKFTAPPEGSSPRLDPEHEAHGSTRPLLMQCPQCGGNLSISHESQRLTTCTFCQSEFYLPDAIWNRLHPVTTVKRWFLRIEGPTNNEQARANKKAREDDEKREEEEAARAREAYDRRQKEEATEQAKRRLGEVKIYNRLLPLPFALHALVLVLWLTVFRRNTTFFVVGLFVSIVMELALFVWGSTEYTAFLDRVDEKYIDPTEFNSELYIYLGMIPVLGIFLVWIGLRGRQETISHNLRSHGYGELGATIVPPNTVFILLGVTLLHVLLLATLGLGLWVHAF